MVVWALCTFLLKLFSISVVQIRVQSFFNWKMLHDILGSFICDFVYFTHIWTIGLCVCVIHIFSSTSSHIYTTIVPFANGAYHLRVGSTFSGRWKQATIFIIMYGIWYYYRVSRRLSFNSYRFSLCVISNQILKPYRICSECGFLRNWHFYFYELLNNKLSCVLRNSVHLRYTNDQIDLV